MAFFSNKALSARFRIVRVLGEGYFGQVYLARDLLLPRLVAIKELKPQFVDNEEVITRFANDARAAAALAHENIVTVYDIQPQSKPPFIILEYLEKGSLRDRLNQPSRISISECVNTTIDICKALGLAHERGIIHRDVKPENILVSRSGSSKLCDFGIAHLPRALGGLQSRHENGHPGTLTHRSPEQVRGGDIDGRSDLFAVGAVLYELLTAQHYFSHATFKSPYDFDHAVLTHSPQDPRSFNSDISAALAEITLRLLEKRASDRFKSASDVITALQNLAKPLPAVKPSALPVLTSINTSARREGERFRYNIRLEAVNSGNADAKWGGLTLHLKDVIGKAQLGAEKMNAWSVGGNPPTFSAPGDLIWGFNADKNWGQLPATCLMVESVVENWKPGHQISMDATFLLEIPRLEANVRSWSVWQTETDAQVTDGDPSWHGRESADQQGISSYHLSVGYLSKR